MQEIIEQPNNFIIHARWSNRWSLQVRKQNSNLKKVSSGSWNNIITVPQCHTEVLLKCSHLNGHTIGFIYRLKIHLARHNKQYRTKVLLNSLVNGAGKGCKQIKIHVGWFSLIGTNVFLSVEYRSWRKIFWIDFEVWFSMCWSYKRLYKISMPVGQIKRKLYSFRYISLFSWETSWKISSVSFLVSFFFELSHQRPLLAHHNM